MAKIAQYFKDKAKTIKDYPKTLMKAVYGDDGKRLDNIISDIQDYSISNMYNPNNYAVTILGDGHYLVFINNLVPGRKYTIYNFNNSNYAYINGIEIDNNASISFIASDTTLAIDCYFNFPAKDTKFVVFEGEATISSYIPYTGNSGKLNSDVSALSNNIGNTDISNWGSTLTGAIKSACEGVDGMGSYKKDIVSLFNIDVLDPQLKSGRYYVNNSAGLPNNTTPNGYLDVYCVTENYKKLIFTPYGSTSTYVNACSNGTWIGWTEIVHFSEDNITPNTEYIDKYRIWRVSGLTIISFSTKKECPAWSAYLFFGALSLAENYIQDFNGNSYKASYRGLEPAFYMAIGDYTIISIMS